MHLSPQNGDRRSRELVSKIYAGLESELQITGIQLPGCCASRPADYLAMTIDSYLVELDHFEKELTSRSGRSESSGSISREATGNVQPKARGNPTEESQPDGDLGKRLESDAIDLLDYSMNLKPIFIRVWDGKAGLNIRDIRRWKWDESGHLGMTVPDGTGESTYVIHGEDAHRAYEVLQEHSV